MHNNTMRWRTYLGCDSDMHDRPGDGMYVIEAWAIQGGEGAMPMIGLCLLLRSGRMGAALAHTNA
jgi:hypothetical protein